MDNADLPPDVAKELWRGSPRDYPFRVNVASGIPESFYTAVGHLSKQWSDIEFCARSVLGRVVGVDSKTILLLTSGMQSRTLLDTTRRAIYHVLPDYAAAYDRTHDRLIYLHEYRNRIMHSTHSGGMSDDLPARTTERKVRLNKKGLSFYRTYKPAAHQVERHALLARLLALKLMDIGTDVHGLVQARRGSPSPSV